MIEARGIGKRFGALAAVDCLDLKVARGQVAALVGENGAGKTTTLRLLSGFFEPDEGTIEIDGHDLIAQRRLALQQVGYVPESAPLYPDMRVVEYLRYRARLKGVARSRVEASVSEALERTDIIDREAWLIERLSRGLRQRVALADALLGDASVLILDEPTAGLDPVQVGKFVELIRELAKERAVLIASHALAMLETLADTFVVIARGAIVGRGDAAELCRLAGLPDGTRLEEVFSKMVSQENE